MKYIYTIFILSPLFFSCQSSKKDCFIDIKVSISKFGSDEPIYAKIDCDSNIVFYAEGFDFDNDIGIIKFSTDSSQISMVVPVKNNSRNVYRIARGGIFQIPIFSDRSEFYSLSFSGNDYLTKFEDLIDFLVNSDTTSQKFLSNAVERIMLFSEKSNFSQYSGYQLSGMYPEIVKKDSVLANKVKEFSCGKDGQFFEFICTGRRSPTLKKPSECLSHNIDSLILQVSQNTSIHPNPIGSNIIVITFWATWCQPCKKVMEYLNDLNKSHYEEKPVYFLAISIDDDSRLPIEYWGKHSEKFNFLVLLHDNGCMRYNYGIESIPQTFIYNFNGKLVATNPDLDKIKNIIDEELKKE